MATQYFQYFSVLFYQTSLAYVSVVCFRHWLLWWDHKKRFLLKALPCRSFLCKQHCTVNQWITISVSLNLYAVPLYWYVSFALHSWKVLQAVLRDFSRSSRSCLAYNVPHKFVKDLSLFSRPQSAVRKSPWLLSTPNILRAQKGQSILLSSYLSCLHLPSFKAKWI